MAGSALVVGGSRGIGLAIARRLAAGGDTVAVLARSAPPPDAGLLHIEADLEDEGAVDRAIDACLKNPGTPATVVFAQRARRSADQWAGEVRVSLSATRQVIERLAAPMAAAGGGAIAIVGSVADRLVAEEQPVGYHVAKAGLAQMVRYYGVTLGPRGIRVNGVVPGSVLKPAQSGQAHAGQAPPTPHPAPHPDASIIPLRRVPTPDDIANVVAFLCSPQAACVTGQQLMVDSGLSLLWQSSLVSRL